MSDSPPSPPNFTIRLLATDAELARAFPLMHVLRPHLAAETFVADVRSQRAGGYVLAAGFRDSSDAPVVLAGFRTARTLFRGPHLFVDDLVTDPAAQGRGYGKQMIAWLRDYAAQRGLPTVWLDSRVTAKGFYERCGFTMNTSTPCWIASTSDGNKGA